MPQEQTPGFTIEQTSSPEIQTEHAAEAVAEGRAAESQPAVATPAPDISAIAVKTTAAKPAADPMQKEVEGVLTENIAEIYKQLPADKKSIFKQKGEEVAAQIIHMVRSGLMQAKKILSLIREWLEIIPGVNKFFLEQEAKIKTDKIQHIFDREHATAV